MTLSTRWSGFAKVAERGRRKCGVFGFFLSLLLLLCLSPRSFFLLHSPVSNLPVRFFFFQVRAVFAVASGFHLRFVVLQKKKKKKRSSFFFLLGNSFLSSKLFIVRREKELDEIGGWALRSSSLLTPRRPERGALSHYERHASLQRQGDCCWRKWHRGESRRCHRRRRQSCDAFDKQEWCSGRSLFFHCASLVPKKRRRLPLGKWPREMVLSSTERRAGQREKRTEKETNDASLFFAAS